MGGGNIAKITKEGVLKIGPKKCHVLEVIQIIRDTRRGGGVRRNLVIYALGAEIFCHKAR